MCLLRNMKTKIGNMTAEISSKMLKMVDPDCFKEPNPAVATKKKIELCVILRFDSIM